MYLEEGGGAVAALFKNHPISRSGRGQAFGYVTW